MSPPTIAARSVLLTAVFALFIAACGGSDDTTATTAPTSSTAATTLPEVPLTDLRPPSDYDGFRRQDPACGATAPPEITPLQFSAPDDMGIDPVGTPRATIVTSCGVIVAELDPSAAPATVNSFAFLAGEGYFDGTVSHRVLAGFVVQAGDPTATGFGNPGYSIPDEFPEEGFVYERGVLAMANGGPGTTGSQFFIMLDDAPLPPQFSVFGTVVEGFEVLDAIAALPVGPSVRAELSVPLQTLYLESVTVEATG